MVSKLIVGLGNPGRRYEGTRHNLGFEVLEILAQRNGIALHIEEGWATLGRGDIGGKPVLLAKPQTYVNRSGVAVQDLCHRYAVESQDLIVIHDDLDLPLGVVRVRSRGGHGGHNGVRSILESLGTDLFVRVKIGIGRPPDGVEGADYVLSLIPQEERPTLKEAVGRAAEAVEVIVTSGTEAAMNRFNASGSSPQGRSQRAPQDPLHCAEK